MPLHFTVLASGSAGNASLLEVDGFGLLLDAGLGPRKLVQRLNAAGASWSGVHAAVLTHTHSDHWSERTLAHLLRRQIPIYCHAEHHAALVEYGTAFASMREANLVNGYQDREEFSLGPGLRCRPLALRHDGGATFGFRFEIASDLFSPPYALGYAADLGSWTDELAGQLAEVDVLALEFNHDEDLERASGRSPQLIARVLGEDGHLSNTQASMLLQEVLRRSTPGRLQHLVQLHLSRDCNRPGLAAEAAQTILNEFEPSIRLRTASQDEPSPKIIVGGSLSGTSRSERRSTQTKDGPRDVASGQMQPSFF
ncbi:MAG TPA: MBL fold metallo-hydrolase [Gemmataceae bacterium]|nr:MBL fold metallo-hydrolase [Gemmataceae bacterium]